MNLIERLQSVFNQLNKDNIDLLDSIYDRNMVFEDPAHTIKGIDNFKDYCKSLYQNTSSCKFEFIDCQQLAEVAFLEWKMYLTHPRLNKGNQIVVNGISKIIFNQKIIHHRDYFDLGQMLYEQLPCIGSLIRSIKRKLGQS